MDAKWYLICVYFSWLVTMSSFSCTSHWSCVSSQRKRLFRSFAHVRIQLSVFVVDVCALSKTQERSLMHQMTRERGLCSRNWMLRIQQEIKQRIVPPFRELVFFKGDKQNAQHGQINTPEKAKGGSRNNRECEVQGWLKEVSGVSLGQRPESTAIGRKSILQSLSSCKALRQDQACHSQGSARRPTQLGQTWWSLGYRQWTSLATQWFRLCASTAGDSGSVLGQGRYHTA